MTKLPIAPGANILVRDAAWRVRRVERVSGGKRAIEVVGLSEIVREKEAIFIDGYERGGIVVLDPADTPDVRAGHGGAERTEAMDFDLFSCGQ